MSLSLRLTLACSALLLSMPAWAADAPADSAKAKAKTKAKKKAAPATKAAASQPAADPSSADPLAPLSAPAPAAKAAPAKAPAAKPAPTPAPTPAAPPPPPPPAAAAVPDGYRSVDAYAPVDPRADAEAAKAAEAAKGPLKRLRILPRVGVAVPRTELSAGPLAGAEIGYRLPFLDDRLRLSLGAGYSFTSFKGSRIVPGRGIDPAFIQNTTLVPIELIVSADLLPAERFGGWGLAVGVGYGLYYTQSEISTLGGKDFEPSLAHAFVAALRATRTLGPGSLLVDVRYSEMRGDLGAFDNVGIATFSGFSFCLGYAFDVL
ncbi:MAG TPA: hypothetical protein VGK67_31475 [Myxococcales bacterium]|jgi:hypothetical protein